MKYLVVLALAALSQIGGFPSGHPRASLHDAPPRLSDDHLARSTTSTPFGVGERLAYDVQLGPLPVGEGSMEVLSVETMRGRKAWHTRFQVHGAIPFYRVDDLLESWMDVESLSSMRFVQDFDENGKTRERHYEVYPERAVYQEKDSTERQSVSNPLDEGAFLYFLRTIPLEVGRTYEFPRYFKPDRNPVILKVLRRESVTVAVGTFNALVIQPIIKTRGMFSEQGEALIWLSDDPKRIIVQLKSQTTIGPLNLVLKSYRPPTSTNP
jgi:hypothetical protein